MTLPVSFHNGDWGPEFKRITLNDWEGIWKSIYSEQYFGRRKVWPDKFPYKGTKNQNKSCVMNNLPKVSAKITKMETKIYTLIYFYKRLFVLKS